MSQYVSNFWNEGPLSRKAISKGRLVNRGAGYGLKGDNQVVIGQLCTRCVPICESYQQLAELFWHLENDFLTVPLGGRLSKTTTITIT